MWDKMAKTKKTTPKVETKIEKPSVEKASYFPKILMLFGIFLIAVAVVRYLNFYQIPDIAVDILFLLAGIWMLKLGVEKGFYMRRKNILKKYI